MYLAIPTVLDRHGAREIVKLNLSEKEVNKIKNSADTLKKHLDNCLNK